MRLSDSALLRERQHATGLAAQQELCVYPTVGEAQVTDNGLGRGQPFIGDVDHRRAFAVVCRWVPNTHCANHRTRYPRLGRLMGTWRASTVAPTVTAAPTKKITAALPELSQ